MYIGLDCANRLIEQFSHFAQAEVFNVTAQESHPLEGIGRNEPPFFGAWAQGYL